MSEELIDFAAIERAHERFLPAIAEGFTSDEYTRDVLGVDPPALHKAAEEVAEEPFMFDGTAPAGLKYGTLRRAGLSFRQRELVKKEISDTYFVAFQAAMQVVKDRSA
jgi:hypothetical protein